MNDTRTPAPTNALSRLSGLPTANWATFLLGAIILAALPVAAQGQSLNNNALRLADPITTVQPSLRQFNPTRTLNTTVLRPLAPSTARIAPTLTRNTNPGFRGTGLAPSAAATGLGRLVAPGMEQASAVVARIGSTARAGASNLTVDFDGDGLINFEITPEIIAVPTETGGRDENSLGGLVGQHITMATGTADRVLDSVINIDGVNPATTFEISNGTVILGGFEPRDIVGTVDIPRSDDPPSRRPKGTGGRDPTGNEPQQSDGSCQSHFCGGDGPIEPKPGDDTDVADLFDFSDIRRPPRPEPGQTVAMDELLNVSIMLPLRGREPESDQFSNYGNEEIW